MPPTPEPPQEREKWYREVIRRFLLLCEHYSVEVPDDGLPDWCTLAWTLAITHVPGLQEEKKRGRKNRNQTDDAIEARAKLLSAVEQAAVGKSGHSAAGTTILKQLRARKKAIPAFFGDMKFNTLRGQLTLARKERSEEAQQVSELAVLLAKPQSLGGLYELGRYAETKTASKGPISGKSRKSDPK